MDLVSPEPRRWWALGLLATESETIQLELAA